MLTFLNLEAEGFCSIESLHLQLNPTCTILIKAPNGKGKAQPLEEPVLTDNGWKKMGELTLNDKVINPVTGKPIKLLGIYDRGLLDTYKITFLMAPVLNVLETIYGQYSNRVKLKTD